MKAIKVIFAAIVMLVGASQMTTANAQFRFGVVAGVNVGKLDLKDVKTITDKNNQAGFTGGLMAEFTVPVIGVGGDISAMYVRRNAEFLVNNNLEKNDRDYIEIPINLKWKISLPVVNNLVRPYIATGPSFSFLTSKKAMNDAYKNKSFYTAWNVGFGVELLNHLQIGARYGFGLTKALKAVDATGESGIKAKNNYWTVTAAYLF